MYNLSSICFMCLVNNKNLTTLYHTDAEYITTQQLKYVLPEITFSELGIPVHICSGCHSALQSFHEFKTKCLDSFYRLKDYIKTTQGTSHDQQMKCAENNNDRLTEQQSDVEFKEETEDPLLSLERRADVQNFAPESVNIKEEIIESESDYSIEEGCHPFQFVKCEEGEPSNISRNDTQNEAEFFADSEVKEFQCTICDKKFTRSGYLKQHMRSIHTEEDASNSILGIVPDKSRAKYQLAYERYEKWCEGKDIKDTSKEKSLLMYFGELGKVQKPTSLWCYYSMLKTEFLVKKNVDIKKYTNLTALLKTKSEGYHPKKHKVFTRENITRFLQTGDNMTYLCMKVILIFGLAGGCRREELTYLRQTDVIDEGVQFRVIIPNTKSQKSREFIITPGDMEKVNLVEIVRQYVLLRNDKCSNRFFLGYRHGKCTKQPIGINTIGTVPKLIAQFLNLSDPEEYTGHCFRRSSTLLANTGHITTHINIF